MMDASSKQREAAIGLRAGVWGAVLLALTLALGGCVGEPVDSDEDEVAQGESSLIEGNEEAEVAAPEAPKVTAQPLINARIQVLQLGGGASVMADPDPNPWTPPKNTTGDGSGSGSNSK